MSPIDDAPYEMDTHPRRRRSRALDDADVVGLLRGVAPADRPHLAGAAALAAALRDLPAEAPEPRGALAALLRDGFDPATVTPAAHVPPSRSTASRVRRTAVRLAGVSLAAKALLGTGVAFAGVAAAATGGVLPDAVGDRVTRIVELVTPGQGEDRTPELPPVAPEDVRQDTVRNEDDQRRDGEAPTVTVPGPRGPVPAPQAPVVPEPARPDADERKDGARPSGTTTERGQVREDAPRRDADAPVGGRGQRDADDPAGPRGGNPDDGAAEPGKRGEDGPAGDQNRGDGGSSGERTDDGDAADDDVQRTPASAVAPTADVSERRATSSLGR